MSALDSGRPAEPPRGHPGEAIEMSAIEKLACEREARHDVLARHRFVDAEPVQHYLMHTRSADGPQPTRDTGARPRRAPRKAKGEKDVLAGMRAWLRWGEDGGPDDPMIPPRC